jgi:L-seryl-tRNA(Ser) seleniumtransferase
VGKAKLVAALKQEPLFRALRCDKLILAGLEATVDMYLRQSTGNPIAHPIANNPMRREGIPLLAMLYISNDELKLRAEKIVAALDGLPLKAEIGKGRSQVGGGALPRSFLESTTLDISLNTIRPQELAARLRSHVPPIVGFVERGKLKLDLRTVFPDQDAEIVAAVRSAFR